MALFGENGGNVISKASDYLGNTTGKSLTHMSGSAEGLFQPSKINGVPDNLNVQAPAAPGGQVRVDQGQLPSSYTAASVNMPQALQAASAKAASINIPNDMQGAQINFDGSRQYSPEAMKAQLEMLQSFRNQANGQSPSIAQEQLKQAQQANVASQMAMLASQRGGNNALAQRNAANNLANIQGQTAQQGTLMQLQERQQNQMAATQLAGQISNQGLGQRAQDIGLATQQAGFNQQALGQSYQGKLSEALQLAQQQQQANMLNAQNSQQANVLNYQGALQAAQQNAAYAQQSGQDAFNQQNQVAFTNAQLGQQHQQLASQYAQMGMGAQEANLNAWMQVNGLKAQAEAAAKQRQNDLFKSLIGGGSQVGAAAATPAGAAAPAAAGGTSFMGGLTEGASSVGAGALAAV